MSELLAIALGAALVNNFLLVQLLGVCPFIGGTQRVDGAIALGLAMALVLALTAGAAQLVDLYLLRPYDLVHLRLFALLLVVGAAVGGTELALRRFAPVLQRVHNMCSLFVNPIGIRKLHNHADLKRNKQQSGKDYHQEKWSWHRMRKRLV